MKTIIQCDKESLDNKILKRCSCFDDDCEKVRDKNRCFIGINKDGTIDIGIADGYCPFIHNKN